MDLIFKALGDAKRRALLDSLRQQDGQSLGDLEAQLEMTRFGVMKHLGVLEEAGLITTRREGRFKYHYLNAAPLQEVVDRWVEPLIVGPTARGLLDLKNKLEGQMSKPDFVMSTFIRCSQDALWDALTDAETASAYHFACRQTWTRDGNQADLITRRMAARCWCAPKPGSTPRHALSRPLNPSWAGPDVPLERSRFVYLIEPQAAFCKLTVEHYDLPAGPGRYRPTAGPGLSGGPQDLA